MPTKTRLLSIFPQNLAATGKTTTDNVTEGSTNLYYTSTRANADFDTRLGTKSTSNLTEGTNLYYTSTRANADFDTRLGTKSTTNLAEGTNLYYTDSRVGTYLTSNNYATQSYVGTQLANLVDSSPATLDTLNELAAALGDDPNFATTVSTSIGLKAPLAGPALTGNVTITGNTSSYRGFVMSNSGTATSGILAIGIPAGSGQFSTAAELGDIVIRNERDTGGGIVLSAPGENGVIKFAVGGTDGTERGRFNAAGTLIAYGSIYANGSITANNGRLVLRDDSIENHANNTDSDGIAVNYFGYQQGTTRFRDFNVYNGKNALVLKVRGSDGNIGIGTNTPSNALDVYRGSGDASARFYTNSGGAEISLDATNGYAALKILSSGTEKWRVGQVGQTSALEIYQSNVGTRLYVNTNGITVFNTHESINLYGIRGRFTNEYIHLYSKVGIGNPSGWGLGEVETPEQGLSTYGAISVGYGTGAPSAFAGRVRVQTSMTLVGTNGSVRGGIGLNRDVHDGTIFDGNYSAYQMHNNQGNLEIQRYNSSGAFQGFPFYVSGSTGNVGIGTVGPNATLHVNGTTWFNASSGDTTTRAIGTTISVAPSANFNPGYDPTDNLRALSVVSKGATRPSILTLRAVDGSGTTAFWDFVADPNTQKFFLQRPDYTPVITATADSKIGINTISPLAGLHVATGTILSGATPALSTADPNFGGVSIGFDGSPNRAQIVAHNPSTAEMGLYTKRNGESPSLALYIDSQQNVSISRGNLQIAGTTVINTGREATFTYARASGWRHRSDLAWNRAGDTTWYDGTYYAPWILFFEYTSDEGNLFVDIDIHVCADPNYAMFGSYNMSISRHSNIGSEIRGIAVRHIGGRDNYLQVFNTGRKIYIKSNGLWGDGIYYRINTWADNAPGPSLPCTGIGRDSGISGFNASNVLTGQGMIFNGVPTDYSSTLTY